MSTRLRPALAPAALVAGPPARLGARRPLGLVLADALSSRTSWSRPRARSPRSLWEDRSLLAEDAWVTLQEVVLGFAIAAAAGLALRGRHASVRAPCAAPSTRCWSPPRRCRSWCSRPILVVWFGFGIVPKLLIVALICFFPITVNTLDGLRSVDPELIKMMRTLGAGPAPQILLGAELPSALPYFFSGAKVAIAVAVIGAVFGEWAGVELRPRPPDPRSPRASSPPPSPSPPSSCSSLMAIALFGLVALIERRVVDLGREGPAPMSGQRRGSQPRSPPCCAAALLAACGEKQEDLDGRPRPAARSSWRSTSTSTPTTPGSTPRSTAATSRKAGLDVRPQVPSDPSAPIQEVAAGRADLAISYEPEVLLAREQGLDVIAVAALVDEPLTSLISLPAAGIEAPADLRGKTVATAGIPYQSRLPRHDPGRRPASPRATVETGQRRVQPAAGAARRPGRRDPGRLPQRRGRRPRAARRDPRIVPVDQLGVPTLRRARAGRERRPVAGEAEALQLFLAALAQGTADAVADPEAATASVLAAGEGLDPALTRAEVDATLPLLAASEGERFGQMDSVEWELFASWMADNQLISEVPDAGDVLTNELLPGG